MRFRYAFIVLIFLTGTEFIWADTFFPENYEVRNKHSYLMSAPTIEVLRFLETTEPQRSMPHDVKVKVVKNDDFYYLLFLNSQNGSYPVSGRGNYILKRSIHDGSFLQLKIFLGESSGNYLRIKPSGTSSVLECVIGGRPVANEIKLSLPFFMVLEEPFERIYDLTRNHLPWDSLLYRPYSGQYNRITEMIKEIRKYLPLLGDADDGALDEDGNFVFIESGEDQLESWGFNCSGFAKWIADGLFATNQDGYMNVSDLKVKHEAVRGHQWSDLLEDSRDPYFGLDWTRNIAVKLAASNNVVSSLTIESLDVRNVPFNVYREDIGFSASQLKQIMYFLAKIEPGHLYFGSVNGEFGRNPVLHQHYHVMVLLPYFENDGSFKLAIFERNRESAVEDVMERYAGEFIHLTRADANSFTHLPQIIN